MNKRDLNADLGVGTLQFWLFLLKSSRQPEGYQAVSVLMGEVLGSGCKQPTA